MRTRQILIAALLGLGTAALPAAHAADNADTSGKQKQSVGEYASDTVVTRKVKAAIVADKSLSALDIAVETNNGVVTLTRHRGVHGAKRHRHPCGARRGRRQAGQEQPEGGRLQSNKLGGRSGQRNGPAAQLQHPARHAHLPVGADIQQGSRGSPRRRPAPPGLHGQGTATLPGTIHPGWRTRIPCPGLRPVPRGMHEK